jgi:hypothetical protein
MKLLCINDLGKPNEIPDSLWIKRGEVYVLDRWIRGANTHLVVLVKPVLDKGCFPYTGFAANRFSILPPGYEAKWDKEIEKLLRE